MLFKEQINVLEYKKNTKTEKVILYQNGNRTNSFFSISRGTELIFIFEELAGRFPKYVGHEAPQNLDGSADKSLY